MAKYLSFFVSMEKEILTAGIFGIQIDHECILDITAIMELKFKKRSVGASNSRISIPYRETSYTTLHIRPGKLHACV